MGNLRNWCHTEGHSYHYRYHRAMDFFREFYKNGNTALEVGCNDGTFAKGLGKLGFRVTAIDADLKIDPMNLDNNVNYIKANLWDLGNSCQFDVVHLGQVVEHVNNPDEFMQKVLKLCKPGAPVFFSVPNFINSI